MNTIRKTRIGKETALKLAQNSKGRFMTMTFTTKDGNLRTMNCRYKNTTPLGYLRVIENGKFKTVNLQTLSELRTNKKVYSVR